MPRTLRASRGGICYHVMTRGNARAAVFLDAADYAAFVALLRRAQSVRPVELFAWCLMPNHVHLVVRPAADGDLGVWMHWLLTTFVRHHQRRYASVGRIWQGRFKAFPIQQDVHFLTVLRYVERNPVRASIVSSCRQWPWSSTPDRDSRRADGLLSPSPVPLPDDWAGLVDAPLTQAELESIRGCAARDRPFGEPAWVRGAAERLELLGTLRPRGRPPIARIRF